MDERWREQSQRAKEHGGNHRILNQEGGEARRENHPDPNVFPTGEPHLIVRHPVLIVPPVLVFGALLYKLITLWLSGW